MHKYKSVDTSCSSDYSVSEEVVSSYARLLLDVAARLGLTKARCRLVSPESPNAVAAFPGPEGIEVLVHAVPGREAKEVEYPSLFGYSSRGDRPFKSYAPAEIGQVVCDSAGQPVAEVVGRTVYCLYDPGDLSESWSDEVFVRALLEAAAVMRRTTHDAEIQEIWNLYGREQSRHAYSGFAREMLREKHDDLKERLAECEQSIRDDGQSLNKAVCARENVLAEIRQLAEVDETKEVERLAKEFDSICRSSKVVGIRLDGDKLVVDTSMIIVPYRGRRYAIGRFRIIVSQNGHLQFHNLENLHATGARMHPHIHMDGNACFGSLSDGMYKLAAKRNYSALITIALQFLEAEPADGGHLGKVWEWKEIKQ
jgi:hypothetical protein